GQLGPFTFYIEGVHESKQLNDITLTFDYDVPTCCPPNHIDYIASAQITVTPLVQSLAVSAAGGNLAQNIFFVNGVDATQGIQAGIPPATPGGTFKGSVTYTSLNGKPVFIQNVTLIGNGSNGTELPNGHSVGYLYAPGSNPAGANLVLKQGLSFPILDS